METLRRSSKLYNYASGNNHVIRSNIGKQLLIFNFDVNLCTQSGVVPFLLETVGSKDKELQEASAACLRNIRALALRAEEFSIQQG